jgi:predicted nucleic acid-binding protein
VLVRSPELEVLLKLEMLRQNRPMAEIVREAVAQYVSREAGAAPPGAGQFASGRTDTASDVDAALAADAFGGSPPTASARRGRTLIEAERRGLILPAPVIPEVDHLLGRRLGDTSRRVFYQGLVKGHYYVGDLPRPAYARLAELNAQFSELNLGFVDAAVAAIAEGLGIARIATTDRRHFATLAAALGFAIVP